MRGGVYQRLQGNFQNVKRSSDPTGKVGKNRFCPCGCQERKGDESPLVPIRRQSRYALGSDAAIEALQLRDSFLEEIFSQDAESELYDLLDEVSVASSVSDVTNPTAFLFPEYDTDSAADEVPVRREDSNPNLDLPPRPAARELTGEYSSASEDFSVDRRSRNEDSIQVNGPPPPPPAPRSFAINSLPRQEPQDKDTPPSPFKRVLSVTPGEASLEMAFRPADQERKNRDSPPRPYLKPEESLRSLVTASPPSALSKIAKQFVQGVPVGDHTHHLRKYEGVFVGKDAVDFMLASKLASTREDAVFLGKRLVKECHLFYHVTWDHSFKDGNYFYRLTDHSNKGMSKYPYLSNMELQDIAQRFMNDIRVANHTYHFMTYKNTFVGNEAVDYLVKSGLAQDRKHAAFLGQRLLEELNLFHHVSHDHPFKDGRLFYRFSTSDCDSSSSISSDTSSMRSYMAAFNSIYKSKEAKINPVPVVTGSRRTSMRGSNSDPLRPSSDRSVTFGLIEERVFERSLSIHPSTTSGPSLGLGWSYVDKPPEPLADDETQSCSGPTRPRDLKLSSDHRKDILREWGHTWMEMFLASRVNEKIREQRKNSLNKLIVTSKEDRSCPFRD